MRSARQKRGLTPTRMMEAFHREERAVDGVVGLIQGRAHRGHLRVGESRLPPRFLGLKPVPHTLTVLCAHRRGALVRQAASALAKRHHPHAAALTTPVQQGGEL